MASPSATDPASVPTVSPAAVAPSATRTTAPPPTADPTATPAVAATPGSTHLVARPVSSPPAIDGAVEDAWVRAEPLQASLTWGMDSSEHALEVEMRALHTDRSLYLLAQWAGGPPPGEDTVSNVFTLHWRIPEPAAGRLDCEVACHTAHADGLGRIAYANAETIPPGGSAALEAAGGWEEGTWTLEWSRPLLNSNPFDLQFSDLDASYVFMVKVFQRIEGRPDPVSGRYALVFER